MTPIEFQEFLRRSGIKKKYIAETVLGTKHWVLGRWISGTSTLYPLQQKKLDDFCREYYKNNPHMQG